MFASSLKGLPSSSLLGTSSSIWILDSGASHHMSYDPKSLVSLNLVSSILIMIVDGTSSSSFYLWPLRLRDVSSFRLKYLDSTGALGKLQTSDISDCRGCKLEKFPALPFI